MSGGADDSAIRICNAALGYVSAPGRLRSFPENATVEGVDCALYYGLSRRELLRLHAWSFATATARLDPLPGLDHPIYRFAYRAPAAIRILKVQARGSEDPVAHKVEALAGAASDGRGPAKGIVSDAPPPLYARYVDDAQDGFDPLFEGVLSLLLARKLAQAFGRPRSLALELEAQFRSALAAARAADSSEDHADPRPASTMLARL